MTVGGLSSLLIAKAMLRESGHLGIDIRAELDAGIWSAFAWLQKHYAVDRNPASMAYRFDPSIDPKLREALEG